MPNDPRIVYGARCVWWDSITAASIDRSGFPCCPHCGGVLFETSSIEEWNASVKTHPGYREFVDWLRGKCFRTIGEAYNAYEQERNV